jgi:hypothetical protein
MRNFKPLRLLELTVATHPQTACWADNSPANGQDGKGPKPKPNWLVNHCG